MLDCSIVERCANGQEVIRFLEQSPSGVDIIISDIRMAGADAWTSPAMYRRTRFQSK